MRICHVITGLTTGGAETMLARLVAAGRPLGMDATVISLMDGGTVGPRIEALGVTVHGLGLRPSRPSIRALGRLRRILRAQRPDIVQGWMYHGNLAASLGGSRAPVLWNVRQSLDGLAQEKRGTAAAIRLSAWLSTRPARIIYNSGVSARQHEAVGFSADRRVILPNGFEGDAFRPDPAARAALRDRLGLSADTPLVGMVARLHPMKGHGTFLAAAGALRASGAPERKAIRFVVVGRGVEPQAPELAEPIRAHGLEGAVHLLGERSDVASILPALDVLCCPSSWGEGFPNAVGEAMACGVPCVVTDVGDASLLLGPAGETVPPCDPSALADAIARLLAAPAETRAAMGAAGRARILEEFSLATVAERYRRLYAEVLG